MSWTLLGFLFMGCAPNPNLRVQRLDNGQLQVDGPLAGPFPDTETLAARACELMTGQGGASAGLAGSEYCALHYYAPDEGAYYLSYLSDVRRQLDTYSRKTCEMPTALRDLKRVNAIILGAGHNHPHNRQFSPGDLQTTWNPSRAVDKETGRSFHRALYLFFRERTGVCNAYRYDYASKVISALRDGQWIPIGRTVDDSGNIQMLDGADWLP
ncbi:hypothetical protein [Corallococcus soli]|uniref:hypothetical protein n=1 Tax=Corallococcus soli TaxID=2710757 RepID=UPI001D04AD4C|nr:hypothetical protein [Corallococcus soli]